MEDEKAAEKRQSDREDESPVEAEPKDVPLDSEEADPDGEEVDPSHNANGITNVGDLIEELSPDDDDTQNGEKELDF